MTCKNDPDATHYKGCDCHEELWQDRLNLERNEVLRLRSHISDLYEVLNAAFNVMEGTLNLIAAPKRSDGTYNRSREACQQLASDALKKLAVLEGKK